MTTRRQLLKVKVGIHSWFTVALILSLSRDFLRQKSRRSRYKHGTGEMDCTDECRLGRRGKDNCSYSKKICGRLQELTKYRDLRLLPALRFPTNENACR